MTYNGLFGEDNNNRVPRCAWMMFFSGRRRTVGWKIQLGRRVVMIVGTETMGATAGWLPARALRCKLMSRGSAEAPVLLNRLRFAVCPECTAVIYVEYSVVSVLTYIFNFNFLYWLHYIFNLLKVFNNIVIKITQLIYCRTQKSIEPL